MATYKTLGQVNPASTSNTTLFTAAADSIGATLVACNQSSSAAATIRVAVRPAGATLAAQHYILYDVPLKANESLFFTVGLSFAATDVLTVYASTANVSFTLTGVEAP